MTRGSMGGALLMVAMVGVVGVACKPRDKGGSDDSKAAPITVSAADLTKDYKENEVRADGQYKNKRLQVTGVVGDIKKDFTDKIYVTLGTGKQFELQHASAYFGDEHTQAAAALSRGTTVTVDCKCTGLIATIVVLKECRFVGTPVAAASASAGGSGATVTAADVCQKLETAGAAKSCAKSDTGGMKFEIVGLPPAKGSGAVEVLDNDKQFGKYVAGAEASPPTSPLRPFFTSAKARAVVHLAQGAPATTQGKAKAVVDGL